MKRNTKKAFTLIEMVIVIAVIAILSAVVIPTYASVVNKARFTLIESEVEILMDKIIVAFDGEVEQDDFSYGHLRSYKYGEYSFHYFCVQNGVVIKTAYKDVDDIPTEYRDYATNSVFTLTTNGKDGTSKNEGIELCFHLEKTEENAEFFTPISWKVPVEVGGLHVCRVLTKEERDNMKPGEMSAVAVEEESAVATTSTVQTYDSFMQAYYDCLTENYGYNVTGSCGYVALGMLLSYYDTYKNDGIIPENYDVASEGDEYDMRERRNSPGVLFEDYSGMTDLDGDGTVGDAGDYYAYYESVDEESLHAKLITIGGEMGYYDEDAQVNQAAGLTMSQIEDVLESYIEDVAGLDSSDYTIETVAKTIFNADKARDWAIEQIQAGKPVLLGIGNEAGGGHAVVAYDYDEETDEIYCHFGWDSTTTHTTPEDEKFYTYSNAMVITFTDSHSHSDNYKVGDSEYCYCSTEISVISHNHRYTTYENLVDDPTYGNERHTCTCDCGASITEDHEFDKYVYVSAAKHNEVCSKCGAVGDALPHNVNALTGKCTDCGRVIDLGGGPIVGYTLPADPKESEVYSS